MKRLLVAMVVLSLLIPLVSACCGRDCIWDCTCQNWFTGETYYASGDGCMCSCRIGYEITHCYRYCGEYQ